MRTINPLLYLCLLQDTHELFAHQYFDSSLPTWLTGELLQEYHAKITPPSEYQGTSLHAPKHKPIKLPKDQAEEEEEDEEENGDNDQYYREQYSDEEEDEYGDITRELHLCTACFLLFLHDI